VEEVVQVFLLSKALLLILAIFLLIFFFFAFYSFGMALGTGRKLDLQPRKWEHIGPFVSSSTFPHYLFLLFFVPCNAISRYHDVGGLGWLGQGTASGVFYSAFPDWKKAQRQNEAARRNGLFNNQNDLLFTTNETFQREI
jgi:hypothetical protein